MPKGKPRNGRRYRKFEKLAIAAAAMKRSHREVARIFGCAPTTVAKIINDPALSAFDDPTFKKAADLLATQSMADALKTSQFVTDEKFEKSSLVQLGVFKKISLETANLARDRPTSIVQHDNVTNLAATLMDDLKNRLNVIDAEIIQESPNPSLLNNSVPSNNTPENEVKP